MYLLTNGKFNRIQVHNQILSQLISFADNDKQESVDKDADQDTDTDGMVNNFDNNNHQ